MALASADEPQVQGDVVYQYWDQDYECVVIGVRVEKSERILVLNNHLLIVVVRASAPCRAGRRIPGEGHPRRGRTKPMLVPFFTDTYLLAGPASGRKGAGLIWIFCRGCTTSRSCSRPAAEMPGGRRARCFPV